MSAGVNNECLRGLLLVVVEAQNILQSENGGRGERVARLFAKYDEIQHLVAAPETRQLITQARSILDPPAAAVCSHASAFYDELTGNQICSICRQPVEIHQRAIPAEQAGIHT